jgi:hypothetical protein
VDDKGASAYLEEARKCFRAYKKLGEGALAQVHDDELFVTLDAEANSLAIIVKHLAGNMRSRWTDFLTSDGEKADRRRDQEFIVDAVTTRADVMRWWDQGWQVVFHAVDALQPADLLRTVTIREEPHSVLQAVNRQIAHYAYHVGQIVMLAKHFRSSEWKSLSVPRGKSEEYLAKMRATAKGQQVQSEFKPVLSKEER